MDLEQEYVSYLQTMKAYSFYRLSFEEWNARRLANKARNDAFRETWDETNARYQALCNEVAKNE